MFKGLIVSLLSLFLLFACAKKDNKKIVSEETEEEKIIAIYTDALEALKIGDAFYAGNKFREVESLLPQSKWAAKSSLMAGYSDYTRNAYSSSILGLKRYIKNYPADNNITYAHYLIAICYFEQILDEKKDLEPLIRAQKKFEFIILKYPESDYAVDSRFKLDLIIDQLAAKEMYIARYYMQTEKWIAALNRLKTVVEKYDKTIFIEEALHRLVEVNYKIGLIDEARKAAAILGYNYQSSKWYERSYEIFNKKYKTEKIKKERNKGLVREKIKGLFE